MKSAEQRGPRRGGLVLVSLGFILAALLFLFRLRDRMADFEVNYTAGKRLRMAETLYRAEDEHYQFKYFPPAALLYVPLSFLSLEAAKGIWFSVILFSSVLFVFVSDRLCARGRKEFVFLPAVSVLVLLKFFLREVDLGQINTLVALVLSMMLLSLAAEEDRPAPHRQVTAGFLWGLASALKPYALIFLPYFLVKRSWRTLTSGLGFLAFALLAPTSYYGFKGSGIVLQEWWMTFSRSTPTLLTSQDNISLWGFFWKRTLGPPLSTALSMAAVGVLAMLVLFVVLRGRNLPHAAVLEGALLLLCIPLVSPLGWDYTLLLGLPAVMIVLKSFFSYLRLWRVVLAVNLGIMALSLYDLMGREFYAAFMSWSIITLNALVLVGYLAFLRLRRIA